MINKHSETSLEAALGLGLLDAALLHPVLFVAQLVDGPLAVPGARVVPLVLEGVQLEVLPPVVAAAEDLLAAVGLALRPGVLVLLMGSILTGALARNSSPRGTRRVMP